MTRVSLRPSGCGGPAGGNASAKGLRPGQSANGVFSEDRYPNIPPGFQISVWALARGARFMAVAPNGDVFLSQPSAGRIVVLRPDATGGVPAQFTYTAGLNNPQGLAFDSVNGDAWLYVGESGQVVRYRYNTGDLEAPRGLMIVPALPDGA